MSRRRGAPPPAEALFNVTVEAHNISVRFVVWASSLQQARERCTGITVAVSPHHTAGLTGDAPEYVHDMIVSTSVDVAVIASAPGDKVERTNDRAERLTREARALGVDDAPQLGHCTACGLPAVRTIDNRDGAQRAAGLGFTRLPVCASPNCEATLRGMKH